ncbi:MAG: tetratricopeptide repeat protein [Armatimonadetes bacterium]|nr:tetratricopeptide repeat protein [Armatimonadota bacterium]
MTGIGDLFNFVCLVMWLLAIGACFVFLLRKAMDGELARDTFVLHCIPLGFLLIGFLATNGRPWSPLLGLAIPAYIGVVLLRLHQESQRAAEEVLQRELDKWGRAVADDDRNSGAHLYLGNALVERRDYEAAAAHYRRALELDPTNVRELREFLLRCPGSVAAEVEARLPDLDRVEAEVRRRGGARPGDSVFVEKEWRVVGDVRHPHLEEHHATMVVAAPPGEVPREANDVGPAPRREWLGAADEPGDAGSAAAGRLSELRGLLDRNPDDTFTRAAYAAALEAAGDRDGARAQLEKVLRAEPGNQEAAAALQRLTAPAAGAGLSVSSFAPPEKKAQPPSG